MSEEARPRLRLVDLFVLVVSLGTLLALLLPVIGPRRPAHRVSCANNLRQASLALFQFENNKQRFPGYLNRIGGQPASWVVPVVPYLERVDLLQAWEGRAQSGKPEPLAVTLNFLVCPADESNRASLTPLSYVANAGIPDLPRPDGGPADKLAHGVFHNRLDPQAAPAMTLKFLADHDGTACTLLLSENVQAGQWAGSGQYLTRPNGQPVVAPKGFFTPQQAERLTAIVWHAAQAKPATAVAERRINVGHDRGRDEALSIDYARPSSFHRGGASAVMADGSVRFLSDQIDYGVYVALMTPDGATSDAPDVPLAAGGPATWGQAATWRTIDAERLSRLVDGQR